MPIHITPEVVSLIERLSYDTLSEDCLKIHIQRLTTANTRFHQDRSLPFEKRENRKNGKQTGSWTVTTVRKANERQKSGS